LRGWLGPQSAQLRSYEYADRTAAVKRAHAGETASALPRLSSGWVSLRSAGVAIMQACSHDPSTGAMTDEQTMKAAMQAYIDCFNRSDAAAIADLYADDATVEDPVGSPLKTGKAAIAEFYKMAVATGARLELAAPIRASHGNAAAMAFNVRLNMPEGKAHIQVIDVMTFNDAGKFTSMKAYWGKSDMVLEK
jgi:steroid Delta-isomerase